MEPKGHHQRGYLPHRDYSGALQAITFREADSLPTKVIAAWKEELQQRLDSTDEVEEATARKELHFRIARYEDAGHGQCLLRQPALAGIVQKALSRQGSFWARDYFDRAIRDQDHFQRAIAYIHRNPVKAGLVKDATDWPFSSIGANWPMPAE